LVQVLIECLRDLYPMGLMILVHTRRKLPGTGQLAVPGLSAVSLNRQQLFGLALAVPVALSATLTMMPGRSRPPAGRGKRGTGEAAEIAALI
jgi:hypothetical protein